MPIAALEDLFMRVSLPPVPRVSSAVLRRVAAAFFVVGLSFGRRAASPKPPQSAGLDAGPDLPPGSNEDFIVNVGRRIYFTENSAELTDTAKVTLNSQAQWLAKYPSYKIKIEGFADEKGSAEFNKSLGLKRAEATLGLSRPAGRRGPAHAGEDVRGYAQGQGLRR